MLKAASGNVIAFLANKTLLYPHCLKFQYIVYKIAPFLEMLPRPYCTVGPLKCRSPTYDFLKEALMPKVIGFDKKRRRSAYWWTI